MTLLGWIDDRHELRPAWKFSGQSVIAVLVATAGVRLPVRGWAACGLPADTPWILTVTNAMNFTDTWTAFAPGWGSSPAGSLPAPPETIH